MRATVFLEATTSFTAHVDVPDDIDPDGREDYAVELALQMAAGSGICAQCSGWGKEWSKDEGEWDCVDAVDGAAVDWWNGDD